jgi:hypothetical protein
VERPTRALGKPTPDFGALAAAMIVEDQVDQPPGRDVAFEAVQKARKFVVPVALHSLPDHRAVKSIKRHGPQGLCASSPIMT